MTRPIVDGQPQPKQPADPFPRLRDLHPQPVVMEISLDEWLRAEQWPETVPMDLSELGR